MASWWNWNPAAEFSLNPLSWTGLGAAGEAGAFKNPSEESERQRKEMLARQAAAAGRFAGVGEAGYKELGADARQRMDYLRRIASGEQSIAGEQLRQGLEQNQAALRSQAASAAPQNQAMAARTAMIQGGKLGAGLSGQQAIAGLQERRDAEQALAGMTMGLRGQDLQAALGSRQTAMQGYGAGMQGAPEKSALEKYGPMFLGAVGAMKGG
jgi:hypothetical protein